LTSKLMPNFTGGRSSRILFGHVARRMTVPGYTRCARLV
jgi:hypothetical protein